MTSIIVANNGLFRTDYHSLVVSHDGNDGNDGNDGDLIENDTVIKNLHKRLIGIINFSSSHSSSCKKKGFILKKFNPFFSSLKNLWVRTKKITQSRDMYAVIDIIWNDYTGSKIECSVVDYIGEVSQFYYEQHVIKSLSISHWNKKVDKVIRADPFTYDSVPSRVRYDKTDTIAYSIDPVGCRDIDDALHYRVFKDGVHEIGIHIADVSSYFPLDSDVWKEMSNRVETVYTNEVRHMFPSEFSIDTAALSESKPARAMSMILTLDGEYNIIKTQFVRSIINVKNITYEQANNSKNLDVMMLMNIGSKLCQTILNKKLEDSHQMVEVFMVIMNNEVAKYMINSDFYKEGLLDPLIRVQDNVDFKQLPQGKLSDDVYDRVKHLRTVRASYKFYSNKLNNSHNGLGLDLYTHATSPIRRYADILVHQTLHAIIMDDKELIPKINIETVFRLNHFRQYYKKCIIYENEIELVSMLEYSFENMKATIVDIVDNRCRVLIHAYDNDYIFDVDIFNKKLTETVDMEITSDGVILRDCTGEKQVSLCIGDIITVKICYIPLGVRKLKAYITDPDIYATLFIT